MYRVHAHVSRGDFMDIMINVATFAYRHREALKSLFACTCMHVIGTCTFVNYMVTHTCMEIHVHSTLAMLEVGRKIGNPDKKDI